MPDNDTINIKVFAPTEKEVDFTIKKNIKLSKLEGAYATQVGRNIDTMQFWYNGTRIKDDDTPASLEMDDWDTIDVKFQ